MGAVCRSWGIGRYDSKVAVAWRVAPLPSPELQFAQELLDQERDCAGLPDLERQMMRIRLRHRLNRVGRDRALRRREDRIPAVPEGV